MSECGNLVAVAHGPHFLIIDVVLVRLGIRTRPLVR